MNIDKLKNEEHFNLYQQKINEKLEDTDEIHDMQIEWNKIRNVIVEAVKESLGETKGERNENGLTKNVEWPYKKRIT
jgi:predicted transcriptional regulator